MCLGLRAGCGLKHKLENCFYVFDTKAPKNFRGRKDLKENVAKALEKNENLKKKVYAMNRNSPAF